MNERMIKMSKKVFVISASPRKDGNSDTLCNEFVRGAQESGNDVEKVRLSEKNIGYCKGCGVCNNTHKCVQKDDMAELLDKMIKADVIVFATPVYFYTMDAQLKTFIDRSVPRYTEISGKEFYYITTAAETDEKMFDKVIESIRGFTVDCLDDAVEKGIIKACGVWQKGEVNSTVYMNTAYEMGKNV